MAQNDQTNLETPSFDRPPPTASSCRRKKNFGSGSFVSDLRDHMYEFLQASSDEHRICLKDTFRKIFKTSKVIKNSDKVEGESSIPLQTAISD